ncbi:MAG: hypothetical protein WCO06_06290, partial [Candidatus Roizmanbacteria bacterium]
TFVLCLPKVANLCYWGIDQSRNQYEANHSDPKRRARAKEDLARLDVAPQALSIMTARLQYAETVGTPTNSISLPVCSQHDKTDSTPILRAPKETSIVQVGDKSGQLYAVALMALMPGLTERIGEYRFGNQQDLSAELKRQERLLQKLGLLQIRILFQDIPNAFFVQRESQIATPVISQNETNNFALGGLHQAAIPNWAYGIMQVQALIGTPTEHGDTRVAFYRTRRDVMKWDTPFTHVVAVYPIPNK